MRQFYQLVDNSLFLVDRMLLGIEQLGRIGVVEEEGDRIFGDGNNRVLQEIRTFVKS